MNSEEEPAKTRKQHIIVHQNHKKSIVLALLFTIVLGPLGLSYVNLNGAIICAIAVLISVLIDSENLLITVWIVSIMWALIESIQRRLS